MTSICGTGSRCERHDNDLHGYPCWACQEEWARRSPRSVAAIRAKGTTPSRMTQARKQDAADRAAYDGPHETTVTQAGPHGPVSRLWNAVCTEGCGWSHYWLPSKTAARHAANEHLADGASITPDPQTPRRPTT